MMTRPLLFIAFLLYAIQIAQAQPGREDLHPCGSPPGKTEWLKQYQQNPQAHLRGMDTALYIPLTIHLLGQDNGSGYLTQAQLLDALCGLNSDFEEANIQFFVEGDIRFLPNSAWNDHGDVLEGAEMMFLNNVENTINTYFVSDPAGNCGYNLPYAGIAMAKSCSGASDHTWAHEVGHNLSVQHPFLGWEGGITHDGTMPPDYNNPAPTTVTYDYTYYKDTLIVDTLIIDTALVELVDGSNCQIAADGFCDTSPDYLAFRWNCGGNGQSNQQQTDPSGAKFRSDGSLIMGYANDACQARFTPEQIAAMRANLLDEKADYLYNQTPAPPISTEPIAAAFPLEGELVQYDAAYFEWEPLENAAEYLLQVSRLPTFPGALTTTHIVFSNSFTLPEALSLDRDYYWRVRGYNSHSFCNPFTPGASFRTAEISAANSIASVTNLRAIPNPAANGQPAFLELEARKAFPAGLKLLTSTGQLLQRRALAVQAGNNRFEIPIEGLAPGLYFIWLESEEGRAVERLVVR